MGVRHGREYVDILKDLTEAVSGISRSFSFFEMEEEEWNALGANERREVMEALADDVFFGLGEEPSIAVGDGFITYHPKLHIIEVTQGDNVSRVVRLI